MYATDYVTMGQIPVSCCFWKLMCLQNSEIYAVLPSHVGKWQIVNANDIYYLAWRCGSVVVLAFQRPGGGGGVAW